MTALDEMTPSVELLRALVDFDPTTGGDADDQLDRLTGAIVGWERIVSCRHHNRSNHPTPARPRSDSWMSVGVVAAATASPPPACGALHRCPTGPVGGLRHRRGTGCSPRARPGDTPARMGG